MRLPPGTDVRIACLSEPFGYVVIVAAPPLIADLTLLEIFKKSGSQVRLLTHSSGVNWSSWFGMLKVELILTYGGAAILQFETLADAITCHRRFQQHLAV